MQTAFFKRPLSANELPHVSTFKELVKFSIFVADSKKRLCVEYCLGRMKDKKFQRVLTCIVIICTWRSKVEMVWVSEGLVFTLFDFFKCIALPCFDIASFLIGHSKCLVNTGSGVLQNLILISRAL